MNFEVANAQAQTQENAFSSQKHTVRKRKRVAKPAPVDGYVSLGVGSILPQPDHWSTQKLSFLTFSSGKTAGRLRWKLGVRGDYNLVYDTTNFYEDRVDDPQKYRFDFDETYIDTSKNGWDFRLGRQNIIWGELVGQYVADVISARDLREFILPEIDQVRVPQWAFLAEKYVDDFHFEALFIPMPTFDLWSQEGDDYFLLSTQVAGFTSDYSEGSEPNFSLSHSNWGARFSYLLSGWDSSLFYYSSFNREPAIKRTIEIGVPINLRFEKEFYRTDQVGLTLSKDLDDFLLKFEAVYIEDELVSVNDATDADGLSEHEAIKGALSIEPNWLENGQLLVQLTDKMILNHKSALFQPEENPYITFYLNKKYFDQDFEAEVTTTYGLHYHDSLIRPRFVYNWSQNLKHSFGYDMFSGPQDSPLGIFDRKDRVYTNLKYFY